jgi:hypothetical protein
MLLQFSKMRSLIGLLLAGVLGGSLGGCANAPYDPHGYLDRRDSIELSAGDANASNIAIQMVDPWPVYAGNKNIAFNGQRMQAAVEHYRNNQVPPPRGISPSGIYQSAQGGNSGNGASNTTPVGPTITQVK